MLRNHFFCFYGFGDSVKYYEGCLFVGHDDIFIVPLAIFSLFIFITTIFTFFISDKIFKRWQKAEELVKSESYQVAENLWVRDV